MDEIQKQNMRRNLNDFSKEELIGFLIESREQRDEFKTQSDNFKKGNQSIAERILKIGSHLEKAEKLCKLH